MLAEIIFKKDRRMRRAIAISLSPNTFAEDIWRALGLLIMPWRWQWGTAVQKLRNWFRNYLGVRYVFTFDSARSGWYTLLQALGVGAGDEVLMQALTCVVVPNPVLWVGARPVYVDVDERTFNMDPADLKRKITPHSKVLLIQHAFGNPADMEALLPIARENHLIVIEDCAQALGATIHEGERQTSVGRPVGIFGKAAFFSFGRDKIVSGVYGGAVTTNDEELAHQILAVRSDMKRPSLLWTLQQILHPLFFAFIMRTYFVLGIGKLVLVAAQKLRLLSKAVYPCEKKGKRHHSMPRKMPNAMACLVLGQLRRLEEFNNDRRDFAFEYRKQVKGVVLDRQHEERNHRSVWLRFTVLIDGAEELLQRMKRRHILLGDWYLQAIIPRGVNYTAIGYNPASCPVAERIAPLMLNLPTYPRLTIKEVWKVIEALREEVKLMNR
jgi:dTDP-4-amino-4,6-dideoxygalactose transaminase